MLENTLKKIVENLNLEIDQSIYKKLSDFFDDYEKGEYVYAPVLSRRLRFGIKNSYRVLEALARAGYLERNYEIYCHDCRKSQGTGGILETVSMAADRECVHCGKDIDTEKDLVLIYKVIK